MQDLAEDNVACRICMDNKDNCVSLFSQDLSKKIMEIAAVQVEKDDGLPDSICTECENDLEKCYEFRLKVQVADKKFRENIKFSQVDIAECNIKQERYHIDDGNFDNADENDSVSMDDEHYNEELDVEQQPRSTGEVEPDPLNHVVVVEEKERKIEMAEYTLGQEDVMSEEPQLKTVEEPAVDPLVCMKEETDAEVMDVDSNQPDPFGPSVSVRSTELPKSLPSLSSLPPGVDSVKTQFEMKVDQQPVVLPTVLDAQQLSPAVRKSRPQDGTFQDNFSLATKKHLNQDCTTHQEINVICENVNSETTSEKLSVSSSSHSVKNVTSKEKHVANSDGSSVPAIRIGNLTSSLKRSHSNNESTTKKKSVIMEAGNNSKPFSKINLKSNKEKEFPLTEVEVIINTESEAKSIKTSQPPSSPCPTTSADDKDEYFCSVCNTDFGFPELLDEHKNRKEHICRACTTIFSSHNELETHFFSHRKFRCEFCKTIFYVKADLYQHKNNSSTCNKIPTKLKCEICHNRFVHEMNLQTHMEQKHPDAYSRSFTCDICNSSFMSSGGFRAHMKSIHTVYESMECDICHKILLGPLSLKTHVKNKHLQSAETCPVCSKVYSSKTALNNHLESHIGEEKVCDVCGAVVKGRVAFKHHVYYHESRTYSCTLCNITLNSLSEKNRHYRENHKNTPKAICEVCGKEYKSLEILKHHMVTHSDVKPHVCDVCGAAFKTKTVLKTHSRVHNDLRKYACTLCGESFKWKQTFDKHVLKCVSYHNEGASGGAESD